MIIVLSLFMLLIAIVIKADSKGPVMFRQIRVTQYGKRFRIFKFRTMTANAETIGTQITTQNDARITKTGRFLRKYRLDEVPQLFNIITGDMSFVGTRPEVEKYVDYYTTEMMATLLLPAGITSEASIRYKDEEKLLENAEDADNTYFEKILPEKMEFNLEAIKQFCFITDIKTMFRTVHRVAKKDEVQSNR